MAEMYPILEGAAVAPGGAIEVGNKAWNLMRMAQAKLPVPAAFVLPTGWCGRKDVAIPLQRELSSGVAQLEAATSLVFGGTRRPLLVSVRSGAARCPAMCSAVAWSERAGYREDPAGSPRRDEHPAQTPSRVRGRFRQACCGR